MQAATIVPTHYLDLIEGKPYQMALAHLVGVDKEYTEFYKKASADGAYVILDNGVIETGVPMTIQQLVSKAKLINATEIIIPDFFRDMDKTIESAHECMDYMCKHPEFKVMIVPQARTMEDWIACAEILLELKPNCIGIPKVLTDIGGRDARLNALKAISPSLTDELGIVTEVHLLGCWSNPIEVTMIEKAARNKTIAPVRGVDSAIAYVYSRDNMLISQGPRPTGEIHFNAKDVSDVDILKRNIQIWEESAEPDVSFFSIR